MKHRRLNLFLLPLMALSLALPANALAADDEEDDGLTEGKDTRKVILIMNDSIVDKTEHANTKRASNFSSFVERLSHEFVTTGMYRIILESSIADALKNNGKLGVVRNEDDETDGRGVPRHDYNIALTIVQYGFAGRIDINKFGNKTQRNEAIVEVILQVSDGRTGEIMKSYHYKDSAQLSSTGGGNLQEQALQTANAKVAKKVVRDFLTFTPIYILGYEGGTYTLDASPQAYPLNTMLTVRTKGKRVKSRRTGKLTYTRGKDVAILQITSKGEDVIGATLVSGAIKPDPDAEEGEEYYKYEAFLTGSEAAPVTVNPPPAQPGPQPNQPVIPGVVNPF
ncbi:MAG: hypothetical protein ACI4WT_07765 [Oligosphaeraceae bacterium]